MKKIILGSLLALCIAVPALAHPPITVYVDQQKVAFSSTFSVTNFFSYRGSLLSFWDHRREWVLAPSLKSPSQIARQLLLVQK